MGKNYNMISPGVETYEIDNSGRPATGEKVGPVVIGRASRGPAFRPVRVKSMDDFIQIFGSPDAGGIYGDVWRDGKVLGPTYGAYAAQAYLNKTNPLTFVRILGDQNTNATSAGKAGWKTSGSTGTSESTNGGAYGLFLIDSGSLTARLTGTLAATFYLNEGSLVLSGSYRAGAAEEASAALIGSVGTYQEFSAVIRNKAGTVVKKTNFNFNPSSEKFIRKVFNTNPTLCNSSITATTNQKTYWLGETYERAVQTYVTGSGAGLNFGFVGAIASGSTDGSNYQYGTQSPRTGWFIGQDTAIVVSGSANGYSPESAAKLFRIHGLNTGEWEGRNLKVSIEDIKAPVRLEEPYGSFTLTVRAVDDSDGAVKVLERYTSLTLNPLSQDYIGKRIGDMYTSWDYSKKVEVEYGTNPNVSKFVRVEVNPAIQESSENPSLLPFGVYGPPKFRGFTLASGSTVDFTKQNDVATVEANVFVKAGGSIPRAHSGSSATVVVALGNNDFEGCFIFPSVPLRTSSSDSSLASNKQAYFGATSQKSSSTQFDEAYVDVIRSKPSGIDSFDANGNNTIPSWVFSLDDLQVTSGVATYTSGSRAAGSSLTAISGGFNAVLSAGFNKFTAPLYGGFDGFDVLEVEPLRNSRLSGGSETTNYAYNSVRRAMDLISDPEYVESNVITVPGVSDESLTTYLINLCETRKDSLAIFDVRGGYEPPSENSNAESSRLGSVTDVVTYMKSRGDNSSYACCYHPWVKMKDSFSSKDIWIPPSVAALGVFGNVEDKRDLWIAPGGNLLASLTRGDSGLSITGVRQRLTKAERDELYSYNINPIANFPSNGITIYGQKTLYASDDSALNRINVRRMMNHIKYEIKKKAENVLFEQNVMATWNMFRMSVEPFLNSIKARFGLRNYEMALDSSTTTREMIDRNSMYAKISLEPERTIEKIYLDFVITNSGIEFTS